MSATTDTLPEVGSIEPNRHGYRTFTLGGFTFTRDEYFAHVAWPKGHHMLPVDAFLRALQRDIALGLLLRHRELRRRRRHREPLRLRRPLRRAGSTRTTARPASTTASGSRRR